MFALELPGGVDDLFLQFSELGGAVALLTGLLLLRLALHPLAFAKDFLEGPHLGEIHVARRAANLSVGADVIGPNEPGNKLVGLQAEVFKPKQALEGALFFGRNRLTQFNKLRLLTDQAVSQPVSLHPEVVPDRAFERNLFERGGPHITAR